MRPCDGPIYFFAIVSTQTLYGWLYGAKVEGLENIPEKGRVIVACNHISAWDPPFVGWAISFRRIANFPTKIEVFRVPIVKWFLPGLHSIPLDRGRGDVGAMKRALDILEQEKCLGIYPEGTRSRTGDLLKPKPGIGFIASESGAPVVPGRVRGIKRLPVRGELSIRFGAPLRFGEDPGETKSKEGYKTFANRVMERISAL
jgi:1-acyl-sn-glycerol-3-phosphate acyltransferase